MAPIPSVSNGGKYMCQDSTDGLIVDCIHHPVLLCVTQKIALEEVCIPTGKSTETYE
jgi:hypothetical protein